MPETDIDNATASDLKSAFGVGTENYYSIATATTDGPTGDKEFMWMNREYSQYLGYYKTIPEMAAVDDAKATWTVGKGFKADEETTLILDSIKGNGKDTFNTIIENDARVMEIGGDSYNHIIRDEEENLINLKPLDPEVMRHVSGKDGMFIRFDQMSKINPNLVIKSFKPEEIFYLPRNRVADEVHGNTMATRLARIITMRNQAMDDWDRVMHRNVDPMIAYKLDTDDTAKIAAFKAKVDAAKGKGENMYIPKDTVEFEILALAPNANLNPLAWIESLNNYFYMSAGVPQIVLGGTGAITEAAVKIAYLAFEQTIREAQLFLEEQILAQLNLVVEFEFPASLENELISDNNKDAETGATQPNDTTAGSEK